MADSIARYWRPSAAPTAAAPRGRLRPPPVDGCSRSFLIRAPRPTVRLNPRVCTYGTIWPGLPGPARRAGPIIVSAARLRRSRARRRPPARPHRSGLARAGRAPGSPLPRARFRVPFAAGRPGPALGPRWLHLLPARSGSLRDGLLSPDAPLPSGTVVSLTQRWRPCTGHRWQGHGGRTDKRASPQMCPAQGAHPSLPA